MALNHRVVQTHVDPSPLTAADPETILMVHRVDAASQDGVRLKRMGICEGRRVQLVQKGDPLILRVVGCRVGVSRHLASQVWVKPCRQCVESREPSPALVATQG